MLCKLTCALTTDGKIVHISEIERGLACSCVCPSCGDMLVARKGTEVGHHFAHSSGEDCKNGFTASLYYAFLRGISELGYIQLPPYSKNRSVVEDGSGLHVIMPQAKVRVNRAEVTKRAGEVTGIVMYCGEKPLILKLLTAYTTGRKNIAKIETVGLPVIEIGLSREDEINNSMVLSLLKNPTKQVYWVYNKRAEDIWKAMTAKCEKLAINGEQNAIYTYGCPVKSKREDGIICYIKRGCAFCEYFFGLYGHSDERYILCGRRQVITEVDDLRLSLAERKQKYGIKY